MNRTTNIIATVQNILLETIDSSSLRVSWDPIVNVPEITGYRVYYRQLTGEMTGQSDGTNFKDVERAETSIYHRDQWTGYCIMLKWWVWPLLVVNPWKVSDQHWMSILLLKFQNQV